jgi:hypothetical protein
MPQPFAGNLRMHPAGQQVRGMGMAEVMEEHPADGQRIGL